MKQALSAVTLSAALLSAALAGPASAAKTLIGHSGNWVVMHLSGSDAAGHAECMVTNIQHEEGPRMGFHFGAENVSLLFIGVAHGDIPRGLVPVDFGVLGGSTERYMLNNLGNGMLGAKIDHRDFMGLVVHYTAQTPGTNLAIKGDLHDVRGVFGLNGFHDILGDITTCIRTILP